MFLLLIFGIFTTVSFNLGHCSSTGGPCYMHSQIKCQQAWTNLWIANMEKQFTKICQYFGDVNSCTMDYMSECKFLPQERELYEEDIVKVYTHKPYSCELLGGNMRYKGQYNSSIMNKPPIHLNLILCLAFLYIQFNK